MKADIIKLEDTDFEYIGLAFFTDNQKDEMEKFFNRINPKLDKVIIDLSAGVFEVAIAYKLSIGFIRIR